jgi:hypothetical protein
MLFDGKFYFLNSLKIWKLVRKLAPVISKLLTECWLTYVEYHEFLELDGDPSS